MEFKRHIYDDLNYWKSSEYRKPLILRGARQVGKTTLVKNFGKNYKHFIALNLEKKEDVLHFLENDNVKTITESIFIANNVPFKNIADTLLFIDEIQELPKAIKLLRYFYEELPQLHVITAGSLLEFSMHKVQSLPVGRVEYLHLHPLNFVEFLQATQHEVALEYLNTIPIKPVAFETLMNLFEKYAIIGGMPEVVKIYIKNNNITDLKRVYSSIWNTYKNDVEKYSESESERMIIKFIMETSHLHIDERVKFQNFGNSNYRSREVGEAFRKLDDAKVIQIYYPSTEVEFPIQPDRKKSPRMLFLDTGLLNYSLKIQGEMLLLKDLSEAYKGAIIPHLISQELVSLNKFDYYKPNFWVRDKSQSGAEVDLVYNYRDKIIPIEIKSGKTGTLKSLHQFIDRTNHPYAIRMYKGPFNIQKSITPGKTPYLLMNLPYFLGSKIPEYIEFFVENNKL